MAEIIHMSQQLLPTDGAEGGCNGYWEAAGEAEAGAAGAQPAKE